MARRIRPDSYSGREATKRIVGRHSVVPAVRLAAGATRISLHMRRRVALAALLSVAFAANSAAQAPTPDSAPRFNRVTSVRELRDGRVLVSDIGQMKAFVLSRDLTSGAQIGRTGEGPGEHKSADLLLSSGDTTLIFDILSARFLHVGPDGSIGRTQAIRRTGGANTLPPEIRANDATGAIYFAGTRANRPSDETRDSVPVLRRGVDAELTDTVAWVRVPVAGMRRAKNADSLIRSRPDPFEWRDVWTVDQSGRVALVRGDEYRMDYIERNGALLRGPVIGGARVPVAEADVQRLREQRFSVTGPNGPITMTNEPAHAVTPVKPFVAEGQVPLVDPNGRVWVERSRAAADDTTRYDVFDRRGTIAFNVALKDNARAVGFGDDTLYATKPDGSGKVVLKRAALPRP
jgi:hypothetical protein